MLKRFNIGCKFSIRLIACGFLVGLLSSSDLPAKTQQINIRRFTKDDGLPSDQINCILQDRQGFLWIGTGDGLVRYDGYRFKTYRHDPNDPQSLSGDFINTLHEGTFRGQPVLWIGTESDGLNAFNLNSETFQHWQNNPENSHSLSNNWILSILQLDDDSSSVVWIGTNGGGLNRFDPVSERFYSSKDRVNNREEIYPQSIRDMALSNQQSRLLWIATMNGLYSYNIESDAFAPAVVPSNIFNPLKGRRIEDIYQDSSGVLWLGTYRSRLIRYDPLNLNIRYWENDPNDPSGEPRFEAMAVLPAREEGLWIGTFNNGLKQFFPKKGLFRTYRHDPDNPASLSNNSIKAIYRDRTNQLWIGTAGGLAKINEKPQPFKVLQHDPDNPNSLNDNYVWSIQEDRQGFLWIGTSKGLNRWDRHSDEFLSYEPYTGVKPAGFIAHAVLSIYEDRNRSIWLGTFGRGLLRFDRHSESFETWLLSDQEPGNIDLNMVYAMVEDINGENLWIGTERGLRLFHTGTKRLSLPPPGKQASAPKISGHIHALHQTDDGSIWIGTLSEGLFRWNPSDSSYTRWWKNSQDSLSLRSNAILGFCTLPGDSGKRIWFGTADDGINGLDLVSGQVQRFTAVHGLPDNQVLRLQSDNNGDLWASTPMGLSRLNPQDGSIANFETNSLGKPFKFSSFAAGASQSGELFFGGPQGVLYFSPHNIRESRQKPPIAFTDFRIFNRPVAIGPDSPLKQGIAHTREVVLTYRAHLFSFNFAVLDFEAPEKNIYAYMMQGFHDQWVELGKRNFVEFTNLKPGQYTLRIRGANSQGVWNDQGKTIRINITPPFWATWWFRLLVIVGIITIVYLLYRYRVNQLLAIERTRTRIARDLHDDVSANLSSISFFSQAVTRYGATKIPKEAGKYLDLINESTAEARNAMDDIIWAINPQHDDWNHFLARLRRYASDLFASKEIGYHFDMPEGEIRGKLGMETQRDIWLIFKEIVTNIIKHADCQSVNIEIRANRQYLEMVIADDGVGFDTGATTDRNGLKNLHARIDKLPGEYRLESSPGRGTQWIMRFKM